MFIALFTIAKTWKQPKCPLMDEWIKKNVVLYMQWSIIQPWIRMKSCHLWQHGWTLGGITLREISQTEKDKYCMISLFCAILINKQTNKNTGAHGYREQIVVAWGGSWGDKTGEGGQKVPISSYEVNKSWGYNVQHGDYS